MKECDKTVGQIGWEAAHVRHSKDSGRVWAAVAPDQKAAWERAGRAVVDLCVKAAFESGAETADEIDEGLRIAVTAIFDVAYDEDISNLKRDELFARQ